MVGKGTSRGRMPKRRPSGAGVKVGEVRVVEVVPTEAPAVAAEGETGVSARRPAPSSAPPPTMAATKIVTATTRNRQREGRGTTAAVLHVFIVPL